MWSEVKRAVAIVATVALVLACVPLVPVAWAVARLTSREGGERGHFKW